MSVLCGWDGDSDIRCQEILSLMVKYRYDCKYNPCGVVGIDIGGNEAKRHPPMRDNISFENTFKQAKDLGFGVTVHAGEGLNCGWDKVKYAIEKEHAMRIGHGYHLATDAIDGNIDALNYIKYLSSRSNTNVIDSGNDKDDHSNINIHFECCPTSSILTNAVGNCDYTIDDINDKSIKWYKHPILMFLKYNIPFSLNTDDPSLFGCDMAQEIQIAKEKFDMSWKQIGQCFINAAKACFLKGKDKQLLIDIVETRVNKWLQHVSQHENNNSSSVRVFEQSKL